MIVICEECDGTGQICHDVGSHNSEYVYSKCKECKGSGRLIKAIHTTHTPFTPGGTVSKRIF